MDLLEVTARALRMVEDATRKPPPRPPSLAYPDLCRYADRPDDAPCRGRGFCPRDPACNE